MSKKWMQVVPPMPQEVAKKAFEQWRIANAKVANQLSPEEVIIDYIRAEKGRMLVRYRVAQDGSNATASVPAPSEGLSQPPPGHQG